MASRNVVAIKVCEPVNPKIIGPPNKQKLKRYPKVQIVWAIFHATQCHPPERSDNVRGKDRQKE
jgi:hypothetical protein